MTGLKGLSQNNFNQQEEEKLIIELFRQEFDDFPVGKLMKTESPDFILRNRNRFATGIELTKLHGPLFKQPSHNVIFGSHGYRPPELTRENIEFTIQSKEEKIYLYQRKRLNQLWLIITTDLSENPVNFNVDNKLANWNFKSVFNRVFLFELMGRKVYELV